MLWTSPDKLEAKEVVQTRRLLPVLLRELLQRVLDHIVMLPFHIDSIGLAPHLIPAIFPSVRICRVTTLRTAPPVTL